MISANKANELMTESRTAIVEKRMYEAMKQGFIGVTVQADLVSLEQLKALQLDGYRVAKVVGSEDLGLDDGIKITWEKK